MCSFVLLPVHPHHESRPQPEIRCEYVILTHLLRSYGLDQHSGSFFSGFRPQAALDIPDDRISP